MNLKVVNIFFVCLITLIIISPSLTVFSLVWDKHIEFVKTQQNISVYNDSTKSEYSDLALPINTFNNSNFSNLYLNPNQQNIKLFYTSKISNFFRWLFLIIPFCIGVTIFLYDRYLVHRAHIFQQQVDMLERIWQQSLEK